MTAPLYMLRLELDSRALLRFARDQGINRAQDEDLGYACHAWLTACFGTLAPKPFRLFAERAAEPDLKLLAYSGLDSGTLSGHALAFASPSAHRVLEGARLAHAAMPAAWRNGLKLGFELLACPIVRQRHAEKDVFLCRVEGSTAENPHPARGAAYREWLAAQLAGAAILEGFELDSFRLVRTLRRAHVAAEHRFRTIRAITRPRALCRGTLVVADGPRFQELLRRGIGRHRAFGYGMLLLRPGG
ncbi:type I-E CRISPR-associated protein Cas6/Cse3/CasE [Candidatus Methylocalor cossyra]|uniref:CRISPR system Cascade subunit CasE n=1 Tax=Candidatus Methylocalor cossyra TaxID=3108543 RepID=A0ABM9NGI3_9GAMM